MRLGWAPDLVGLSVDEALGVARWWDVTLAAIDGSDLLRRFGVVVGQEPGPGDDLAGNECVRVTVNEGPGDAGVREPLLPWPPLGRLGAAATPGNVEAPD